jgi:hypothetical protein
MYISIPEVLIVCSKMVAIEAETDGVVTEKAEQNQRLRLNGVWVKLGVERSQVKP